MSSSNIYIITHKPFEVRYPNNYIPLQVGKKFTKNELPYLSDDTLDNISDKNKNFCELTGVYWIWKNAEMPKYIGITHYRRFFVKNGNLLTDKDISKFMEKYDVILPKQFYFSDTVWNNYFKNGEGKEKDLIALKSIINSNYKEYSDAFNKVMYSNSASYCNMFIMKKDDFYQYCQWLFGILFELEKKTDISEYTASEARIYGYLSELLLNVWIEKEKLNVKYCKMKKIDSSFKRNIKWNLKMLKGYIYGKFRKLKNMEEK